MRLIRELAAKLSRIGWFITSIKRDDEPHHRLGLALDALPPEFPHGVPLSDPPLYHRPDVIRDVEAITSATGLKALIEAGHVHFYHPNAPFQASSDVATLLGG